MQVAASLETPVQPLGDRPIRLLIVDDSAVARAVLARMISASADFAVVAQAGNAAEALDILRTVELDIILLDVEMPGTSGLDALPQLLREGRGARVLILSSFCEEGAEASVRALALGAADTLPKPGAGNFAGRFSEVLLERLRRIGRVDPQECGRVPSSANISGLALRVQGAGQLGCVAIGASTGGIPAIHEFLGALDHRIGAPILISQHLPPVFMPFFAQQLEKASGRKAIVAQDGQPLEPERIFIAPGDAHLALRRFGGQIVVALRHEPAEAGYMPSVDRMFDSVSNIYGRNCAGVIFSGMGKDGLIGSAAIAERGGTILVQDAASSVVWGMPRVVAEAGLASAILPPAELARRVSQGSGAAAWK
jgi:two-component system chemotaxis response regulator CheB